MALDRESDTHHKSILRAVWHDFNNLLIGDKTPRDRLLAEALTICGLDNRDTTVKTYAAIFNSRQCDAATDLAYNPPVKA